MNLLSHYAADSRTGESAYNFGLILPDLISAQQRGWKLHELPADMHPSLDVLDIISGMQQHLKRDAQFHSSEAFRSHTHEIRIILENQGMAELLPRDIRLFFLAHIFYELMLDRQILAEGLSQANKLYTDIESVPRTSLSELLILVGFTEPLERFFHFLDRFLEHRYIYRYIHNDDMVYAITRICSRLSAEEFSLDAKNRLIELMPLIEESISPQLIL